MNVPGQNHRDPWFAAFFKEVLYGTKMLYQTKEGTPFLFPGTGTGAWEAALTNTLSPGDKILTFRCAGARYCLLPGQPAARARRRIRQRARYMPAWAAGARGAARGAATHPRPLVGLRTYDGTPAARAAPQPRGRIPARSHGPTTPAHLPRPLSRPCRLPASPPAAGTASSRTCGST